MYFLNETPMTKRNDIQFKSLGLRFNTEYQATSYLDTEKFIWTRKILFGHGKIYLDTAFHWEWQCVKDIRKKVWEASELNEPNLI